MSLTMELILEGIARGMAESVLKVLDSRFGAVPGTVENRIYATSISDLDRLLDKVSVVPSLDALFNNCYGDGRLAPKALNSTRRHRCRPNRRGKSKKTLADSCYLVGYDLGLVRAKATPRARGQAEGLAHAFLIIEAALYGHLPEDQATLIKFATPEQLLDWHKRLASGQRTSEISDIWNPLDSAINGWKCHIDT